MLTFRAVARAVELPWTFLRCHVTGTVDRREHVLQFTAFHIQARVEVPAGRNDEVIRHALEKAERGCLIANSLKAPVVVEATIERLEPAQVV